MAFEPSDLPISISGSTKPNLHSALPESLSDYATDTIGDPRSTARFMIKNVLLTNPGERIMMPTFGVGILRYLFEQSTSDVNIQLESDIENQLRRFIPSVNLLNVSVTLLNDEQRMEVSVAYEIDFLNTRDQLDLLLEY